MGEKEIKVTFIYLSSLIKLSPEVQFLPRHLSPDEHSHFAHTVYKRCLTILNLINMMYCNDFGSIRIFYEAILISLTSFKSISYM